MIFQRLLSSVVTASVCMSFVQPVVAATKTSDDILVELKAFDASSMCEGREGKNLGRCISDVVKRITALRNAFNDALKIERNAWYAEHGNLGVSSEYATKLQEYLSDVKEKRSAFSDIQRSLEKTFFTTRKEVRESTTANSLSVSRKLEPNDMEAATAKCAKQSNANGLRICLRQQIRLMDPNTRLLNISTSGSRSTK